MKIKKIKNKKNLWNEVLKNITLICLKNKIIKKIEMLKSNPKLIQALIGYFNKNYKYK